MTVRSERKKQHRRVALALAASLLIHLLILLVVAGYLLFVKPAVKRQPPAPKPPEPVELTIVPPPPEPPKPKQREFIDSAQGQLSEKAPENAAFESDRNMVAGSELPPESDAPVPTLHGDTSPGITLQAQNLSLGPSKQPAPFSKAAPARQAQPPSQAQPTPAEETKPSPTPQPTPRPEDSELALLDPARPKPQPQKPEPQKPQEQVRKPEEPSRPSAPSTPGFQPQRSVTRLTGGISSRGRASVNAVATPLGRYNKMLSDAIGSRWYYYVNDIIDFVNVGTVQLRFVVRADGRVENIRVLSNTSNQSLAICSTRAIVEAEIPPIPAEVARTLAGNKLEVDYSFTIGGR